MKAAERRLEIFEILKKQKYVDVAVLAEAFDVSTMTIRRDLSKFEEQGVVTTTYGGATLNEGTSSEPAFAIKSGHSKHNKIRIAYEASLIINDGDSIFIDCGTTTVELARFITEKRITVITNSWKLLSSLSDFSKITLILAPGEYDPISEGAISSSTISFIKQYTVDKAFISTQGIDLDRGVSVPSDDDAQVKKAIMDSAKYKLLLADHTKFHQSFMAKHGNLIDFDAILVDPDIDDKTYQAARSKHPNLVICSSYKGDVEDE
ncbi:DeoR/GlpR transcriptional regulator [Enterococcus hulanensis]|uniref:DeoR/GlpR family DNA-binding transcription regulator n=1 Tax=Enterococcus hulanensis TaxID=2559929 RepID=UPI001A8DCCC5|nr:DeoR/GlpR family DNA-binding transcription regulator [Enterococcus hulanensis]MBO0459441.1 DeoR/GlpR transcriptional regulator [Enterococcus hulanensis]